MTQLKYWFKVNGLTFNEKKTQLVEFYTSQLRNNDIQELDLHGIKSQINLNAKCLPLELYMNLIWENGTRISKRSSSACFQITVLRDTIDLKWRIMIYHSSLH